MSLKKENLYYYGGHYMGCYTYDTDLHNVKFNPLHGASIGNVSDAALNLKNRFNSNVEIIFDGIKIDVQCNSGITRQDIIKKYIELIRTR